ncbi:50S ribosomal protein L15 [Elusimicrobiota bacterium]
MSDLRLDDLKPAPGSRKKKTRKGRGASSGKGQTSGRGKGGSGHRAGNAKRPDFEGGQMPLVRRVPKRGFTNSRFKKEYEIVNVSVLQEKFKSGEKVTPEKLKEKGIVRSRKQIKILGNGDIKKKIEVSGCLISSGAREKIKKAGGEIV